MSGNKMRKLQYALRQEGFIVIIPTGQFYLQSSNRYVKLFYVKYKNQEIFRSSSGPKVIKFLADLYKIVKNKPAVSRDFDKYVFKELKKLGYDGTKSGKKN